MFENEDLITRWRMDENVDGARVARENLSKTPWS